MPVCHTTEQTAGVLLLIFITIRSGLFPYGSMSREGFAYCSVLQIVCRATSSQMCSSHFRENGPEYNVYSAPLGSRFLTTE